MPASNESGGRAGADTWRLKNALLETTRLQSEVSNGAFLCKSRY